MRKVTEKAAAALKNSQKMTSGNTAVNSGVMSLHGNTIAIFDSVENLLTLRDCGWKTATTKERLNGILAEFNSEWRIYQLKGQWYITDGCGKRENWDGWKVFEV